MRCGVALWGAAWRREVGDPQSWVFASFFFFFFSDLAGFLLGCRGGLRWLVGWFEVGRDGATWRGLAVGRGFGLRWVVYLGHCHNPIFFLVFFSRFSRSTWFLSVAGGSFDGFGWFWVCLWVLCSGSGWVAGWIFGGFRWGFALWWVSVGYGVALGGFVRWLSVVVGGFGRFGWWWVPVITVSLLQTKTIIIIIIIIIIIK